MNEVTRITDPRGHAGEVRISEEHSEYTNNDYYVIELRWAGTELWESIAAHYATRQEADAKLPNILARLTGKSIQDSRTYTTVRSPIYGEGRIYAGQSGATSYDDGSGRFAIQIWDNDGEDN